MIDALDDQNFLTYLKEHKPYLYDVEIQTRKVIESSGFGDVSIVLGIAGGIVEKGEIIGAAKHIYYRRVNNVLVRQVEYH